MSSWGLAKAGVTGMKYKKYKDEKGRVFFVDQNMASLKYVTRMIKNDQVVFTGRIIKSTELLPRLYRDDAQKDLDAYAKKRKMKACGTI